MEQKSEVFFLGAAQYTTLQRTNVIFRTASTFLKTKLSILVCQHATQTDATQEHVKQIVVLR